MLEKLPPDVLLHVAFYLSFDNVKKCREVSKSWQAQMENYGLFNSAVIVITPENENQYWKSKLLRFVNTLRVTKFKNSKTDQSKYKGFLRLLAEKQSTNKHLRLECVSIKDFLLVDSSNTLHYVNIHKIDLLSGNTKYLTCTSNFYMFLHGSGYGRIPIFLALQIRFRIFDAPRIRIRIIFGP